MGRVLIVDDDPDVLRIVEKVLKMGGHDVFTASDAMKAMDLLNASSYDMLITDGNMPRLSGFELVNTLKNNKRFSSMAVAMLTGLREKKDLEKAIRAGVDDYIVKPIDPMVLVQKVNALFTKKPPLPRAEYKLPEGSPQTAAQLKIPARITDLTELGLTIRACVDVPEGIAIELVSDFFRKLDLPKAPPLKIISCRKLVEFDYEIRVAFVGVNDAFFAKIRNWIEAHSLKKGKVA